MANEDKKDFNAMLHDKKDMPKIQIITDQKSIENKIQLSEELHFLKKNEFAPVQ